MEPPRTPEETFYARSRGKEPLFTDDDLAKAFKDRPDVSPQSASANGRLLHDIADPSSPWKRSIRLRYSDVNMRDSNAISLQQASDLLSQDMSSFVCLAQSALLIEGQL